MKQFLLILKNDWLILRRGKALKIVATLAVAAGLYSLFYGKTVIDRQRETIATLQKDEQTRLDSLEAWAKLDTSIAGNKAKWETATSAYEVNVPEGYRYAIYAPSDITPLSIGMRDLFPFYQDVWGRAIYRQIFQQEIANPQKLAVGHFDWAFVVIFILPLLLIVLSYSLLSSEKEQGTYSLLRAQPVSLRQIVLAKLSLRAALMVGFLAVIALLSVFVLGINFSENGGLWLRFFGGSTCLWLVLVGGDFCGGIVSEKFGFQRPHAVGGMDCAHRGTTCFHSAVAHGQPTD